MQRLLLPTESPKRSAECRQCGRRPLRRRSPSSKFALPRPGAAVDPRRCGKDPRDRREERADRLPPTECACALDRWRGIRESGRAGKFRQAFPLVRLRLVHRRRPQNSRGVPSLRRQRRARQVQKRAARGGGFPAHLQSSSGREHRVPIHRVRNTSGQRQRRR